MSDVISVSGHLCVDYILDVDEFPEPGTSRRVNKRVIYFGGGAPNIAVGIAKLGGNSEVICAVGKDYKESGYEDHLKNMGVATHLVETKDENCSTAFMVNNKERQQITFFEWGAGKLFQTMNAPKREFVHMATGDAEFNIRLSESAKFSSLDPGQDVVYYSSDQLKRLFANVDLLICNNYESGIMQKILGWSESQIIESVPMAIFTKGKDGSILYKNGDVIDIPAVLIGDAIDPTGAGDAYRSGFFTAYKKGYPLETCCKVGAVTSSFVVEKIGTQTNLADWKMMEDRFTNNFGTLTKKA